jgi:hypothetical protein
LLASPAGTLTSIVNRVALIVNYQPEVLCRRIWLLVEVLRLIVFACFELLASHADSLCTTEALSYLDLAHVICAVADLLLTFSPASISIFLVALKATHRRVRWKALKYVKNEPKLKTNINFSKSKMVRNSFAE